jgi:hypothetical protein
MASKQEIIDDNRYINVEHDWWAEDVISDFIFKMGRKGINLDDDDIKYSGFCSQGDGASFVTQDFDWDLFAKTHDLYDGREWLEAAYKTGMDPTIKMHDHRHAYVHENTVYAELTFEYEAMDCIPEEARNDESDIRYGAAVVIQDQVDLHCDSELDTEITEILRGYMQELYDKLDLLYYELIDDDAVWETLEANNPEYLAEELDDESESDEEA